MELAAAIGRLERVTTIRADVCAVPADLIAALRASNELQSFLAAVDADVARRLAAGSSFPEAALAETTRESLGQAGKTLDRRRTLDAAPALAAALDDAAITPGHIDALTRSAQSLEPEQRERLYDTVDSLVDVASQATVAQFGRRIRDEARLILAADGLARLERQQRATTMSSWVDAEGMWNIRGAFDPVTGVKVAAALENTVETLFATATPATCPSDPVLKQRHLRALAFTALATGTAGQPRRGRPEFVAVIDVHATPDTAPSTSPGTSSGTCGSNGLPVVEFPIPIEVPARVLADLIDTAEVSTVVVRNGIVLHAPGELNLGRTTRLANRAQRRALRGLYRDCAIPGCTVSYNRCKLHHIIWWRNGGNTNLDNLIPVCSHHHHNIHDDNWNIELGPNRQLTITFPDGTIRNTGPPRRLAA